ncbi:hypothetical protein [Paractinoplanes toevensis]|uniref:Uncharacterized protein n=1 Tax=Paractinoplanes toevensis TaxID=571911 RepID=A0A919TJV2_9ACTN|nr:hypothetical protein [Actinoplanes toevensis]GIM95519.1 hypothetical protein Ato02nite_073120 [Actinoplanes toevensis]
MNKKRMAAVVAGGALAALGVAGTALAAGADDAAPRVAVSASPSAGGSPSVSVAAVQPSSSASTRHTGTDDHGGRRAEKDDDHGGRATEKDDDHGSRAAEKGDDHGGRAAEKGDDHGRNRGSEKGDRHGGRGSEKGDDHGSDGHGSDD